MLVQLNKDYGPHKSDLAFELPSGYVVIVGENDAGKTTLLQWLFRFGFPGASEEDICYIPKHRDFVRDSIETSGVTYAQLTNQLRGMLNDSPLPSEDPNLIRVENLFAVILQRTSYLDQTGSVRDLIKELGLGSYKVAGNRHLVNGVPLSKHGSGLRNLMFIAAAVTCLDFKYIFIDEPEASLETKKLKSLKNLFLSVAKDQSKTIIITTHSHMLLNSADFGNNLILARDQDGTSVHTMTQDELLSVSFEMLGNSLSDLYLPDNYVLVEGSSDQEIVTKVKDLLGITKDLRIFSCGSNQNIQPTVESLNSIFGPILENKSPYAKNAVALLDAPNKEGAPIFEELKKCLNRDPDDLRLFVLPVPSLEEYLHEELYTAAGLNKEDVVLAVAKASGYIEKAKIKRATSKKIAAILTTEHLGKLGVIVDCLRRASR